MNATVQHRRYAIYVITKHGVEIAERLVAGLTCVDVFVSSRLDGLGSTKLRSRAKFLDRPMGPTLERTWGEYDCHIHVISVGAVVRMIAPLINNKKTDPAIICVDELARYSIAVLSGHVGRGNEDAGTVAELLAAQAVITTASDSLGTLTVDILGRDLGWRLADPEKNVTAGCAAVVNQARVLFVQETGEPNFWPLDQSLPAGVQYCTGLGEVEPSDWEMLLIVSDRLLERSDPRCAERAVIYRPRSLVLGIGCDRGTSPALVERGVRSMLEDAGLSIDCVRSVATIDIKGDEPALIALTRKYGWALELFPARQLNDVPGVQNPSEVVRRHVGCDSVGEAACLVASGGSNLLLPKSKYSEPGAGRNMTLAVARVPFQKRKPIFKSSPQGIAHHE